MRLRELHRFWFAVVLVGVAASGCGTEPTARSTPVRVSQTPALAEPLVLPSPLPTPSPQPPMAVAQPPRTGDSPAAATEQPVVLYQVEAELDWLARTVQVDETVEFRNETREPLREIVLNVDANGDPERFALKRVVTGAGLELDTYTLEGTQLAVSLPQALAPGALLTLQLAYDLSVPPIEEGYRLGHLGYLGYSERQLNLGNWLPLVAHYDPARGWVNPLPHTVGEQAARRLADFDVTLRVKDAPEDLSVVAPGTARSADGEWRFMLNAARDLTISLSDSFELLSTTTASGIEVELYTFAQPEDNPAAAHALQTAADALTVYETLFDEPYAYERLIVVEGDFPDGMEFSGLVFVSEDWFQAWQGVPNDWLTLITAHEVAHQWWYSVVGSDQGNDPYLDEALAIYSELLYFERRLPEHVAWWWDFRVGAYQPSGYVDAPVYDFHSPRAYINAVYLQGARMMQALREDLGDLAFFGWLQRYADQMNGQLATPDDFWGALTGDEYAATLETRQRYLRHVNVLARSSDLP